MMSTIIPISYEDACRMRTYAEKHSDPYLFDLAANYFDVLGMSLAAQRCCERSAFYSHGICDAEKTIKISAYANLNIRERSNS